MADFFSNDPMVLAQMRTQRDIERNEKFVQSALQQINDTLLRMERVKLDREEFREFRKDLRRNGTELSDAVDALKTTVHQMQTAAAAVEAHKQTNGKWKVAIWSFASLVAGGVLTAAAVNYFGLVP